MGRIYKDESFYLINRKRLEKIQEEVQFLNKEYSLNNTTIISLVKYANNSTVYRDNNLIKIATLINSILLSYGYSSEEISQFMNKNKAMFDSSYADFRYRLGLMHRFGLFETVFFKHYHILTTDFTRNNFGTKDLFSIMHSHELLGISNDLESITNIKLEQIKAFQKYFPFDLNILKKYDADLLEFLKLKRIENIRKKGL